MSPEFAICPAAEAAEPWPACAQLLSAAQLERRTAQRAALGEGCGRAGDKCEAQLIAELEEAAAEGALQTVALHNGAVVGFLQAWIEEHGDDLLEPPFLTVEFVMVAPKYRGQGLAGRLLQSAERHALEQGCTAIDVLVQPQNEAAIKAYSSNGFQPVDMRLARLLTSGKAAQER